VSANETKFLPPEMLFRTKNGKRKLKSVNKDEGLRAEPCVIVYHTMMLKPFCSVRRTFSAVELAAALSLIMSCRNNSVVNLEPIAVR
jgi:hypothetical protein